MSKRELVFLLEEQSAAALLEALLPRFLHASIACTFIAFEGKQDLDKRLEKRLRYYLNPEARFLVLRDQDSFPDCRALKARLWEKCEAAGRAATTRVRIACTELETFYLADLPAVERALACRIVATLPPRARSRFRAPDQLGSPSRELQTLTQGQYQKVDGSRRIAAHLDLANTRSPSFSNLLRGIRQLEAELLALPA